MERQTKKAFWLLIFLAPFVAEIVLGNTLLVAWLNPIAMLAQVGVYGGAAILARELRIRLKGGVLSQFALCGIAGVIVEGLAMASWFNPNFPDLGWMKHYGRSLGTNWPWVFHLQMYHAIESCFVPIFIVELLFPAVANESWITKRRVIGLGLFLVASIITLRFVSPYPVTLYQLALCSAVIGLSILLGWLLRNAQFPTRLWTPSLKSASFCAFAAWTIYFLIGLGAFKRLFPITTIILVFVLGIGLVAYPIIAYRDHNEAKKTWTWLLGSMSFYCLLSALVAFQRGPLELVNSVVTLFGIAFIVKKIQTTDIIPNPRLTEHPQPA